MYACHVKSFPVSKLEPWVVIENPGYGGPHLFGPYYGRPVGFQGALGYTLRNLELLAKDVGLHGFRNPICVWEYQGRFYLRYGASRVYVASANPAIPLSAVVSGPGVLPDGLVSEQIDLHAGTGLPPKLFQDYPQHVGVVPEGFVDFHHCWGKFEAKLADSHV